MPITLSLHAGPAAELRTPILAVALAPDEALPEALASVDAALGGAVGRALARRDFRGGRDETLFVGGANAGVVRDGRAVFMRAGERTFAADLWSRRRGFAVGDQAEGWTCTRRLCRSTGGRPAIAMGRTRKAPKRAEWAAICDGADLVVLRTRAKPPEACSKALVLGPEAFAAGGSAEIVRSGAGWRVVWSNAERGWRPWTSGSAS